MVRALLLILSVILVVFVAVHLTSYIYAAQLESFGLKEGSLIRAADANDPNVFIINEHGYKRLFLNPVIFGFYGHLGGFSNIKNIPISARDSFLTSSLYRNCETNNPKIYTLEITGDDTGILHWLNISANQVLSQDPQFFKKVFCINSREFTWYQKSNNFTDLSQIQEYRFSQAKPSTPPGLSVDLKVNGSDNPGQIAWNSKIKASWTSTGASQCAGFEYMKPINPSVETSNLSTIGEIELYNRNTFFVTDKVAVHIICYNASNQHAEDFIEVQIIPSSKPSLTVTQPTETNLKIGETKEIKWTSVNLTANVNIVLYGKSLTSSILGNYWYIAKNIPNTGSYVWKVGVISEPAVNWGTSDSKLNSDNYAVIIANDEESVFGASVKFNLSQ